MSPKPFIYAVVIILFSILWTPVDAKENKEIQNGKNVFISQQISKSTLFINQQTIYKILFFRKVKTTDAELEFPSLPDFQVQDLEIEREYEKLINGNLYLVTELRYALFPLKPGICEIPPARICCDIIARNKNFQFYWIPIKTQGIVIYSKPLQINVLDFPSRDGTEKSSKIVGTFSLAGTIDKHKVSLGDFVNLTVTLKGRGNLYETVRIVPPKIKNCKIFSEQPSVVIHKTSQGISGSQTFNLAICPTKMGKYTIPPFSVSSFDPEIAKYLELLTAPLCFEAGAEIMN